MSHLEAGYEHLATRADLEALRGELRSEMKDLKFTLITTFIGIALTTGLIVIGALELL